MKFMFRVADFRRTPVRARRRRALFVTVDACRCCALFVMVRACCYRALPHSICDGEQQGNN